MTFSDWNFRWTGTRLARASSRSLVAAALAFLVLGCVAAAQTSTPATPPAPETAPAAPQETGPKIRSGYEIRQTADLGGHFSSISGSGAMYDTLVNIHSGPRVLAETYEMHAVPGSHHLFFDTLSTSSGGFGGDPNNYARLDFSKGKLYDFQGVFRRDRQYFDYNLLSNPLIPSGLVSNGYTFPQIQQSPVLFNSLRRMTDLNLTLLPLSKVTFRFGYSKNIFQGPSFSSIHEGTEGLLLQNLRNSDDSVLAAVDWKPLQQTRLTFEENISHYKGDTTWQAAGLNLQLSNGAPVSLGFDNVTVPACTPATAPPIQNSTTNPVTANPTCNGFLQYIRTQPTRTIFPTEEFRFQSASIKTLQMNGRVRYTGANTNMPSYYEYFNGLGRSGLRIQTITGSSTAKRINVSVDYGFVWQLSKKFSISDQFDFWNFRQPGFNTLTTVSQSNATGSFSMLNPPTITSAPSIATANTFLGQKTTSNIITLGWEATPKLSTSLSYRYRNRTINVNPGGTPYALTIHESGGIFGFAFHPTREWRINGEIEATYDDHAFVQVSPRALQHYKFRTLYKPRPWATITSSFNDLERRDNVTLVNHLDHSRNFSAGFAAAPNEFYEFDFNYGYSDVVSNTTICYTSSIVGTPIPTGTGCGSNNYLGTSFIKSPTTFGSVGLIVSPVHSLRAGGGYRITSINGVTTRLNPLAPLGSLASAYQSPYANIAWTVHPGWIWKGDYNYYGYGEAGAVGPASPRNFHGNILTIGMHYEF